MALQTTIPILMVILSFSLYMGVPNGLGEHTNFNSAFDFVRNAISSMNSTFKGLLGGAILAGVTASIIIFPNAFAIFGGMAALMVGFLTIPNNIVDQAELPEPIGTFIILVFGLMYILALTSWFKGTPDY